MCAGGPRRLGRPRWGWLYFLVVLGLAGLAVDQVALPSGAVRMVMGCAAAIAIFAVMAFWVRRNRVAIEQLEACDCAWEKVTVRVVVSRQPVPSDRPVVREPIEQRELVAHSR